mmetsp:Transcript_11098/g.35648  ORF Transcript_11098/g.35648 Transcript_11098/m.35648 type:complete len:206 (-) Transcript_11098:25-642(-)
MGAVAGTDERLMVSVCSGGRPGVALTTAPRSRTASECRSVLAEIHTARWNPCSHASRMAAACVLPFPTPGPSARRKPARTPRHPSSRAGDEAPAALSPPPVARPPPSPRLHGSCAPGPPARRPLPSAGGGGSASSLCAWQRPMARSASSCSSESTPLRARRRGMAGSYVSSGGRTHAKSAGSMVAAACGANGKRCSHGWPAAAAR